MNSTVYEYLVASGRVDPLFPETQTYFLPADPEAVWGNDEAGNRVLVTRVENLIDAGEVSLRCRTADGAWYASVPASSLELMKHLRSLNEQLDAAINEAAKFSLQGRRDLVYRTLCERTAHN